MNHKSYLIASALLIIILFACAAKNICNSRNNTPELTSTNSFITACNDGIDNDGDGLTDWQYDTGCANQYDDDETSASRDKEDGFTTFDPGRNSIIIFVSSSTGNNNNNGSSPEKAVKTLKHAAGLIRDGHNDFLLLRRGDVWRGESLGRFKSGRDATHPLVIASYGESTERPRIEVDGHFLDHDGQSRSYMAVTGLQIVSYQKIPNDSAYDGSAGGGFRYVGGGKGLLIEDCHILYGELVLQSYAGHHYKDVEIRRNIIEHNYHINTCGQNVAFRPSGIYASHVNGLTIEDNIIDHNGWNEDVSSACATMYNHNLYLNADNLVVRNNIITRASSMGIKMRSDTTGDASNLLFENNLLAGGEIGISIGGNSDKLYRFTKIIIRNNVFSQIGLDNPTKRNFVWMLDVQDNNNTIVENNHFLHQPWYSNSYGIQIRGKSGSDISVIRNIFYELKGRSILINASDNWNNITISNNTIIDQALGSCLIDHNGSFKNVHYRNNRYFSSSKENWFCVEGRQQTLAEWKASSGETGNLLWSGTFPDPDRTVSTYAATLGFKNTLETFISNAKRQNRMRWNNKLSTEAVNNYIRAGFSQK